MLHRVSADRQIHRHAQRRHAFARAWCALPAHHSHVHRQLGRVPNVPALSAAALPNHAILTSAIGKRCADHAAAAPGTVHSFANLLMYTTTMAP